MFELLEKGIMLYPVKHKGKKFHVYDTYTIYMPLDINVKVRRPFWKRVINFFRRKSTMPVVEIGWVDFHFFKSIVEDQIWEHLKKNHPDIIKEADWLNVISIHPRSDGTYKVDIDVLKETRKCRKANYNLFYQK